MPSLSTVNDLEHGRARFVAEKRKETSPGGFWSTEDGKDCLIGTKYLWLGKPDSFMDAARMAFKSLRDSTLKT
jgi:hypothetical protein